MRITLSGLMVAMMLVLGYVESLLPDFIVPGVKLGLSNSILIFAIYMLDIPMAWLMMALKVVLSALLFKGGFGPTMYYALAGGVLSMLAMTIFRRIRGMHPVTVSMMGGVMHNLGQVLMAILLLGTDQLIFFMAVLMITGLAFGAATGVCANLVMKHLKFLKKKI